MADSGHSHHAEWDSDIEDFVSYNSESTDDLDRILRDYSVNPLPKQLGLKLKRT